MDRTVNARTVGSGHTGLVMTCPLKGMVVGETFCHAASSAAFGRSPWIKYDLMVIPSELTRGIPNAPRTLARMISPERNPRRRERELQIDVIGTVQYSENKSNSEYHKTGARQT
jgi:hypothetical protein